MEFDELLPIRNNFYLGSYQQAINSISTSSNTTSPNNSLERRLILLRSYLAQKNYRQASSAIAKEDEKVPELLAFKLLADYFQFPEKKENLLNSMKQLLSSVDVSTGFGEGGGVPVFAATLFYNEGLFEDALKILTARQKDLECASFIVQIYLKMNRPELAKKELQGIRSWADDATLAQLVEAWVDAFSGDEKKFQDAYYIFEELASSKVATSKLLNGQAVCRIKAGRFEEAEAILVESLNKGGNDPETLINLIVCTISSGKDSSKFLNLLKETSPKHPYLEELALKESHFDRCCGRFSN